MALAYTRDMYYAIRALVCWFLIWKWMGSVCWYSSIIRATYPSSSIFSVFCFRLSLFGEEKETRSFYLNLVNWRFSKPERKSGLSFFSDTMVINYTFRCSRSGYKSIGILNENEHSLHRFVALYYIDDKRITWDVINQEYLPAYDVICHQCIASFYIFIATCYYRLDFRSFPSMAQLPR